MASEVVHKHTLIILSPSLCVIILLAHSVCASLRARDNYAGDCKQDHDDPAVSTRGFSPPSRIAARRGIARRGRHGHSAGISGDKDDHAANDPEAKSSRRLQSSAHLSEGKELEPIMVNCSTEKSNSVCEHVYTCHNMESPSPLASKVRVQGGYDPYPRTFLPFVVMHDKRNDDLYCGGVLISEYYFLTSAQCRPEPGHELAIYQTQWSEKPNKPSIGPLDDQGGWCSAKKYDSTKYGITTVIKHDWAIAKLRDPLRPYEPREYGCIPYTAKYMHEKYAEVLEGWQLGIWYDRHIQCFAMGHGWYKPGDDKPKGTSRKIKVIKVRPVACGVRYVGFDKTTGLCFEGLEPNSGVCTRDIGGPVLCRMPHEYTKWWVVGIVSSFVNSTCAGTFFATHVPSVIDDILIECL